MRKRRILKLLPVFFATVLCLAAAAPVFASEEGLMMPLDISNPEMIEEGEVEFDETTLLIQTDGELTEECKAELKSLGILRTEFLAEGSNGIWYTCYLRKHFVADEIVSAVRAVEGVKNADLNYYAEPMDIFDQKTYPSLISSNAKLNNLNLNRGWHILTCGVVPGWLNETPSGIAGKDVVVAVIDSGIDYNHVDLDDNIWINTGEIPGNHIDDDGNGYVDDVYGYDISEDNYDTEEGCSDVRERFKTSNHGTHVSGIIAAENNNKGIAGISYNAKIMALKTGKYYEEVQAIMFTNSDIMEAVEYAVENGADVINLSLGGPGSMAMDDVFEAASEYCVVVAAAGNDGCSSAEYAGRDYPAAYDSVIGVMSVDANGSESYFTNYNADGDSCYDIYAPGGYYDSTGVYSEDYPGYAVFSTVNTTSMSSDTYGWMAGTSMATPFVSAVAANVIAEHPEYTPAQVRAAVVNGGKTGVVTPYLDDHEPNAPLVNLLSALNLVSAESITLNQSAVSLYVRETSQLTAGILPENSSCKIISWSSSNTSVASVADGKITALAPGTAVITAKIEAASNPGGKECSVSCTVTVKRHISTVKITPGVLTLREGNSSQLSVSIYPADATDQTLVWTSSDESVARVDNQGRVTAVKAGRAVITAESNEGHKKSACSVTVTGTPAPAPQGTGFTDVKSGDYFAEAVAWAVKTDVTKGTSPTTFSPGMDCSRGQCVTFLWRAMGSPEPAMTYCSFADVSAGQYYYKAVLWAVENGVTSGTSPSTFSPNAECTRAQVVTFLRRAAGSPAYSGSNPFVDVSAGQYYYEAVLWAVGQGITSGTSANTFSPDAVCTRAQIVTFLWRYLK